MREQDLLPLIARTRGLKTEGQEWTFFQKETCVFEDRKRDLVFNEFAFDLCPIMVGPIKDEHISRLKTLANEVYGQLRVEMCFFNFITNPYPQGIYPLLSHRNRGILASIQTNQSVGGF